MRESERGKERKIKGAAGESLIGKVNQEQGQAKTARTAQQEGKRQKVEGHRGRTMKAAVYTGRLSSSCREAAGLRPRLTQTRGGGQAWARARPGGKR